MLFLFLYARATNRIHTDVENLKTLRILHSFCDFNPSVTQNSVELHKQQTKFGTFLDHQRNVISARITKLVLVYIEVDQRLSFNECAHQIFEKPIANFICLNLESLKDVAGVSQDFT